ncbi:MAG: type II toxin-antitoxin system PemK/MazF family toxin, partial [Nanoarchaeota archaeon]
LIISTDNEKDICVAFISSVVPAELEKTDVLLTEDDDDFSQTKLKKDSVFKMNKIATLDKSIILGRLGTVSEKLQKRLDEKLRIALGL